MARTYREPYDPTRDFVARKAFICQGTSYAPGDSFDRDGVDDRRLRQMYEARWLDFVKIANQERKSSGLLASVFGE